MDKYEIDFSSEAKEINKKRLINQLWKLIPMRENNDDWQTHLAIIIEEIVGLVRIYNSNDAGLSLLSKLEGLDSPYCDDFVIYRKTVFRCIDLLSQVIEYG